MKGIDISNLNGATDIASVKNAGYGFIISKITEGSTFIDKYGRQNVANTKANGLIAGAYHFARFKDKDTAIREAEFFKANCPSSVDFVVLDFEQQCSGDMTDACLAFLDSVSSIAPAIIYCNPNYINLYLNSNITKYPLWIAHYGVSSPSVPKWGNYAIWQYSECGSVPGVSGNADLNVSNDSIFLNCVKKALVQENNFCKAITADSKPILQDFATIKDGVICKELPDNNSKTNGIIPKVGATVNIYGKQGEWYKVNPNQYVAIEWLQALNPLKILYYAKVINADGAMCRENPSTVDKNNGIVPFDTKLPVYKEQNGMGLVNGANMHLQWVPLVDLVRI